MSNLVTNTEPPADFPIQLRFLGVGGASQEGLGHASAVVQIADKRLLIDCGPGTVKAFVDCYQCLPDALFITHCHLDHIGDLENLFIKSWFHQPNRVQPKVYVPASIVPLLHQRAGSYPAVLAEGGVNFWDAFHLIPVVDAFVFENTQFNVQEVRHHAPETAFGLHLPQRFFYTGDTRPIPEIIDHRINCNEVIFHDCGVVGNPSHTGIDDLEREYSAEVISRLRCYHYYTKADVDVFNERGLYVVRQGELFEV
ncbi:MAG: MBL fold metallo-hydrolase [Agarilytica sp.]